MNPVAQMLALEDALLHTNHSLDPAGLDAMLSPDFSEISSSGRCSSRADVVQWLLHKAIDARWQLQDCRVTELGELHRLVHYHARQIAPNPSASAGSLHTSLWRRQSPQAPWQLNFHQATKLP